VQDKKKTEKECTATFKIKTKRMCDMDLDMDIYNIVLLRVHVDNCIRQANEVDADALVQPTSEGQVRSSLNRVERACWEVL